jgi:autotransporter-associated beta strand protein
LDGKMPGEESLLVWFHITDHPPPDFSTTNHPSNMKTKSIIAIRATSVAALLLAAQSAQAVNYWFDQNNTAAGFGVVDGGSYDWTAADVWGAANDGTGAVTPWPSGSNAACLAGAGSGSYTVRLGADGTSTVLLQNLFLNFDGATPPVASGTGDVVIGNVGDTGELQINTANSIGTLAGTLTINNPTNLGVDKNTNFRGGTVVINGLISGTGSSGVSLVTMAGFTAGTLTLNNPDNTYTGATTISSGHTLIVPKIAAGLSTSSIGASSNDAANLVFNGGILRYTGGTVSTDRNFTLTAAATGSFDVSTAGTVLTLTGGSAATTGALTKLGAGTLELAGTNLHTGATAVGQGTLVIPAGSPSFAGGLTFGASAGGTTVGKLDLSTASATFGGPTLVLTNTATANTIAIGEGQTLRLNGAVTVGYDISTISPTTKLTASGLGTLSIGAVGAPTNAVVQLGGNISPNRSNGATLDLSGLSIFYANLGTGTFRVGDATNSTGTSSLASTLILAENSTLIATTLTSNAADAGQNQLIRLGSGTNLIQANTINIGQATGRSGGTLNFYTGTGTLTLRDLAGTGRAAMTVVYGNSTSGANPTGTVNFAGHTVDLLLSNLNIAGRTGTSGANSTGTFTFDSGTLDVTDVIVGDRRNTATNAGTSTGTLTLNGGTTTIGATGLTIATTTASFAGSAVNGTVNIGGTATVTVGAGGITLGRSTNAGIVATAALNITGSSSLTLAGNIVEGLGAGNAAVVSTLNLNGGTLDMAGFSIGTAAEPINTLNFQSGTLKNVANINGGGGLLKSGVGGLILDGTNPYSGGTIVTGGTLGFANTAAQPTNGTIVVTGGGALGLRIGGEGYFSLADVEKLFANTFPNVIMNATSGVGIDTTLGDLTYTTTQTGTNGLSKLGTNTLTLTTAQSYTGATSIFGGSLQLGDGGTVGSLSPSSAITNTGTLIFNRSNDVTQGVDFAGVITGTGGTVIQNGTGTLTLNGANTYTGATAINAGTVTATVAGALGTGTSTTIAGTLNLTAGGITNYTGLTTVSGAGTINVALGTGSNTISLNGNYSGFTGVLNVGVDAIAGAGKVQSNGADNAAATVRVLTNGTVYVTGAVTKNASLILNGGDLGEALGQLRLDTNAIWAGPVTLAGDVTGIGDFTIGNNSTNPGTISGVISETGGSRALSKGGTGTIILTNANTYTGGTTIGNGILRLDHNTAAGTGAITIANAAAVTRLNISGGVTIANPVSFGNTTGAAGFGVVQQVGTGLSALTGPITLTGVPSAGGHFVGGTSASDALVLSGPITSTVGVSQRQGFVIYSGGGAGYPALNFTDTAIVGATNGISTAATVNIGGSAAATLDLNGFDQSLAGITKGAFVATIGNSSTTTDSVLTTTGTAVYAGIIRDVLGTGTRQVSLRVNGGALTLSGANTYTGVTTVNQGTLAVTGSLGASGVTVSSGATLGGNGNLGAPVTIQAGGRHALAVAATPDAQITRTITGTLTLVGGTFLDVSAAAGPAIGTYVLATATEGIIGTLPTVTLSGCAGTVAINGNNLELTVVAPNDFGSWVNYFGLAVANQGATVDADGDGLKNLVEYVLGSNPSVFDATTNAPTGTLVGANYVFTFKRSDLSETDTTQSVEYGSDLTVWGSYPIGASPGVAPVVIQEDVPDATLDTVTVTIPTGGAPKFFARLKVTNSR